MEFFIHKPLIVIKWILYISVILRHWYFHFLPLYGFMQGQIFIFLIHVFIGNKTHKSARQKISLPLEYVINKTFYLSH